MIYRKRRDAGECNNSTIKPVLDFDNVDTTLKRDELSYQHSREAKDGNGTKDCSKTIANKISVVNCVYSHKYNKPLSATHNIIKYINGEKYNATLIYKDFSFIIPEIKEIAILIKSNIKTLYSVFAQFKKGKLVEVRETIFPYFATVNAFYKNTRHINVNNKLFNIIDEISFEPVDVLTNAQKIDNIHLKLMYLIQFLLPTRRIGELAYMRLAKTEDDIKNVDFNWFYNGKFYNHHNKNKRTYINNEIPTEIIELINQLPPDTDYIMGRYANDEINNTFSRVLYNIYSKNLTNNDIRHLYATYTMKDVSNKNASEWLNLQAYLMNHSFAEHFEYLISPGGTTT